MTDSALDLLAPHFFQVAYVVRDIAAAELWFQKILGVPAWTRMEGVPFGADCIYRGRPADYVAHLSIGYLGATQIELIESVRGENLYLELLEQKGPGLHHLGFDVPNFDATVDDLTKAGLELVTAGQIGPGTRFAYFDCDSDDASVIEILGFDEATRAFMDQLRRQSSNNR